MNENKKQSNFMELITNQPAFIAIGFWIFPSGLQFKNINNLGIHNFLINIGSFIIAVFLIVYFARKNDLKIENLKNKYLVLELAKGIPIFAIVVAGYFYLYNFGYPGFFLFGALLIQGILILILQNKGYMAPKIRE
jgi:amino acid transporter